MKLSKSPPSRPPSAGRAAWQAPGCTFALALLSGACAADVDAPVWENSVGEVSQAVADSVSERTVLGFETLAGWSVRGGTMSLSRRHTEGARSLRAVPSGAAKYTSPPLSGLGAPNYLSVDFRLGKRAWWGHFKIYLSVPSAGISKELVGGIRLSSLRGRTWYRWRPEVPASIEEALRGVHYEDMTVTLVPTLAGRYSKIYFDRLVLAAPCDLECQAEKELAKLGELLPSFEVTDLPASCNALALDPSSGIDADDLRGIQLDPNPPALRGPARSGPANRVDGLGEDAPYVAAGILPFALRFFRNRLDYSGWHTWNLNEYAALHGFDTVSPDASSPVAWDHLPDATQFSTSELFAWPPGMQRVGLEPARYDQLTESLAHEALDGEFLTDREPGYSAFTAGLVGEVLWPERLATQSWYPSEGTAEERESFERAYYEGAVRLHTAPLDFARSAGFRDVGLYGWAPVPRDYWGIESEEWPSQHWWRWERYGREVYRAVDSVQPSVYSFYLNPRSPAYVLANIDASREVSAGEVNQKPVKPFTAGVYHGGGGGWRYWRHMPLMDEEQRAITALLFFTGIDGLTSWGQAGESDANVPLIATGGDAMVGTEFALVPSLLPQQQEPDPREARSFKRYSFIHFTEVTDEQATFQAIQHGLENHGVTPEQPIYTLPTSELSALLRPKLEPMAAEVEALAMVRSVELLLKHGEVMTDVSARDNYLGVTPIVRRVRLGKLNVLASYDPRVVFGDAPRDVVLEDFNGQSGCALRIPADDQVRFYVVRSR